MDAQPPLTITLERRRLSRFSALLQRGVAVRASAGRSVHGFLTDELGLPADYVRERITTVFLDGQVVDVLEDAMLRDGSLLALSAAMPGLVGATLRRSGPYAAMRAAITRTADRPAAAMPAATVIRVKLFNLLLEELGPVLLGRGIFVGRREASDFVGDPTLLSPEPTGEGEMELRVVFE